MKNSPGHQGFPQSGDALIVVDVQNDFLPGGSLAVPDGDAVVPVLNQYILSFTDRGLPVFATREMHPPNHASFKAEGGLWPPHCVAGTHGAEFTPGLQLPADVDIISKADQPDLDVYSGFQATDLPEKLKKLKVRRLWIGGLATDYCVLYTVLAAPGSMLVDFGLRRSHGSEAGLLAARASYLAGFTGSSNVLAEREFGIPSYGTMAHSYVQAFDDEAVSFEYFLRSYPQGAMLPIDTYDTEAGAEKIVALLPRLKSLGIQARAVRIDSGDLDSHARNVRAILDSGGLEDVKIFASGNLDEYELERLTRAGAPIDGYGVGTRMDTSSDAPYLDCAYKLQEYAGKPRRKLSEGKATWPGRKQVFRQHDEKGRMRGDILALIDDAPKGRALLQQVMGKGKRLAAPSLEISRRHAHEEMASLPLMLQSLDQAPPYFVEVASSLRALAAELDAKNKSV